ncbi:MAG: hypothetical protein ACREAC_22920, partial [Blastocatellia bacterium]
GRVVVRAPVRATGSELGRRPETRIRSQSGESIMSATFKARVARLLEDSSFQPIKPALELIDQYIHSAKPIQARDLAIDLLNRAWERSQEYEVGRNAFLRRIRGTDFKPLDYANR